jgi:hypothetical protein
MGRETEGLIDKETERQRETERQKPSDNKT